MVEKTNMYNLILLVADFFFYSIFKIYLRVFVNSHNVLWFAAELLMCELVTNHLKIQPLRSCWRSLPQRDWQIGQGEPVSRRAITGALQIHHPDTVTYELILLHAFVGVLYLFFSFGD